MSRMLLWALLVASLTVNAFFLGGFAYQRWMVMPEPGDRQHPAVAEVIERLSLTEAQQQDLLALRRDLRRSGEGLRDSGSDMRQKLLAEIAKPDFDREAFAAVLAARAEQRDPFFLQVGESLHGYLRSLSPEQREVFLELAAQRGFLKRLFFEPQPPGNGSGQDES